MKHLSHKLAAALTVGLMTGTSLDAHAQLTLTSITNNIADGSGGLNRMTSMVAYLCGGALGVSGIFALKQHVDNPAQKPLKDGLIRLGAGGGLLTLPVITTAMQGTVAGTDAGTTDTTDTEVNWNASTFTN